MKKIIVVFFLLALSLSAFNCGGGSGPSETPSGENPGTPSITQLLPSHYIAHTNSDITLHARVLDGNGVPVRHVPVRFTNLSPVGVLSATSAKTNDIGIATVILHSHVEGFATVQAEVNKGVAIVRDKKTVFFATSLNLQPFMILDVDGDGDGIYNESSDLILFETTTDNQVTIKATVFNRFGQRAAFTSVTFGADSLEASFPLGSIKTTDADGEATVLVRVDPIEIRDIQTVLNITADADNGAANMVSLFLQPVIVSDVNVTANPSVLAPEDTSTITASVLLNTGGPSPDGTTVSFIASCGTVTPFAQTTSGIAEAEFTAPSFESTCTITATAGGVAGTTTILVTTELAVFPDSQTVNGSTGGTAEFTIFGGIPPYTIFTSDPLFPANPTSVTTSGGTFTVSVPANTCPTSVTYTIRDSAANTVETTLDITNPSGDPTLAISPATICENNALCPALTETATGTISGGVPPYNTVSDNQAIIVNPGAGSSFTVDAIDGSVTGASADVNFTTYDSCGKTAKAKVTVTGQ